MTRIALILLGIALSGVAAWRGAAGWHPSTERYPVQGVDVGEANGAIEWNAVAASGADFGYAVATHGANRRDAAFEANWQGIAAAGLRRGAIHVYSFCQRAIDQANAFNTFVPRTRDALPAAIAIAAEEGCTTRPDRATLIAELNRLVSTIEAHTGKPALLRVSRAIERDYRISAALPRSVWAVGNVLSPDYAARPWRMWQASDFRRVEGIAGPVHWDVAAK